MAITRGRVGDAFGIMRSFCGLPKEKENLAVKGAFLLLRQGDKSDIELVR
jgi:hypothetical protein